MECRCSSFPSPRQLWGLVMGVEKELGLGLFSQARLVQGNVSISEAPSVNEVGGIFM